MSFSSFVAPNGARRNLLKAAASVAAVSATGGLAFPAIAQSKPFKGLKLRGAVYQLGFFNVLKKYIPEFEQQTGMSVDLQVSSFPIYNQQADLELSSGGSAWDFCNVTFILASRWVQAGLLANLDDFTNDKKLTAANWNPDDFVRGAQLPYRDKAGHTFGYSFEGGAMLMGVSRSDLMKKRGVEIPTTFDGLMKAAEAMNGQEGMSGFVSANMHNWFLPPYVQGFGGDFFVDPPTNITPALDSAAFIQATEFYSTLLSKYSPPGVLGYTEEQARAALIGGRSNIFIQSSSWLMSMFTSPDSKVKDSARVVAMPAGPKGDFPACVSQALGIPKYAKNKEAAWAFIQWVISPELTARIVKDTGHSSICRRSIIQSEEYKRINTVNGQDIGKLYLDVLDQGGKPRNYMAYRMVKEFPQIGDIVNKAVERIASGQMTAAASMKMAQEAAIGSLKRAGAKV